MKKVPLIFTFFLFFYWAKSQCPDTVTYAASGLTDVHFFRDGNIIACGSSNKIIKSYDGGESWIPVNSSNSFFNDYGSLIFTSDSVGYATATYSILKTEDAGESWIPLYIPLSSEFISGVSFRDSAVGFAITSSGRVLKTMDGGQNWSEVIRMTGNLSSIYVKNDSTIFITGPIGYLYRTKDNGKSWTPITVTGENPTYLKKLYFINANVGYAIGASGEIFKTTDGGESWSPLPKFTSAQFNDIFFIDDKIGFAVGEVIFRTEDGGESWKNLNYGNATNLSAIDFDSIRGKLIVVGSNVPIFNKTGRTISTSINLGNSWTKETNNLPVDYNNAQCLDNGTVYITSKEFILKSKDKGESWRPLGLQSFSTINSFFIDESRGFAFADKDNDFHDEMYKTVDSGNNWTLANFLDADPFSYVGKRIFFWNDRNGIAIKTGGIFKTENGGDTWVQKSLPPSGAGLPLAGFIDFSATPSGTGFLLAGSLLFKTNDFGEHWLFSNISTDNGELLSIEALNDSVVFIGGSEGLILRSNDGGKTWAKSYYTNSGARHILDFYFINAYEGYLLGTTSGIGELWKTIDGGKTWDYLMEAENLRSICGNNRDILVAGDKGALLKNYHLLPPVAGYIAGPIKVCLNDNRLYNVAAMGNVQYSWQLSGGGIGSTSGTSNTVFWNVTGEHTLQVNASNSCGTSQPRSIKINVEDFKPIIEISDSLLTASEGLGYQWFRNEQKLPGLMGGSARTLIAIQAGAYRVEVVGFSGCTRSSEPLIFNSPKVCLRDSLRLESDKTGTNYQWQVNSGNGFTNLAESSPYFGTNSKNLGFSYAPGQWYGNEYRCIVDDKVSKTFVLKFSNIFVGKNGLNWENPANWLCGNVPSQYTDVIISGGMVTVNSNAICRSIRISPGAKIVVNAGYSLTVKH